jgi:arylsulfatase
MWRWLLALVMACLSCSEEAGPPARPDVFLISVDTLRADRLGVYGSPRGPTPRLDAWAAESLVFEHAYAPAPLTLPSVVSLLTGRHPLVTGVTSNLGIVPMAVPNLAERLQEAGWRTGAVVSNFALRRATALDRGFEAYDDRFNAVELNRDQPERAAADTRAAALALFDSLRAEAGDDPIFLWVHFQDPHGPYTPPPGYREPLLDAARAQPDGRRRLPVNRSASGFGGIPGYQRLGDEREVGFYRASYDAEVIHTDEEIGVLLDGLDRSGRLEDAIVVFTADHGEGMGKEDYWFAHGEMLGEGLVHVPLMIRAPGLEPGRRSALASLLDVHPTLLSRLGIEVGESEGHDLLQPPETSRSLLLSTFEGTAVPRFAVLSDGEKYRVVPMREGDREFLHDVGDESSDRSEEAPERLAAMRRELERLRASLPAEIARERQSLSDLEKARLRALGYATE